MENMTDKESVCFDEIVIRTKLATGNITNDIKHVEEEIRKRGVAVKKLRLEIEY